MGGFSTDSSVRSKSEGNPLQNYEVTRIVTVDSDPVIQSTGFTEVDISCGGNYYINFRQLDSNVQINYRW